MLLWKVHIHHRIQYKLDSSKPRKITFIQYCHQAQSSLVCRDQVQSSEAAISKAFAIAKPIDVKEMFGACTYILYSG